MNPLLAFAPMALGAVGGRGGAALLSNPAMKLVNRGIDASFALDAAKQVKNLATPKPKPIQKISEELAGLLTTEEATEKTDTKPVAPTVTPMKTNELVSDTRGRHSTQLGSAQIVTDTATKRPPKFPEPKVSALSLKPLYRAAKDIVERYAPAAGHVVTYGGAVLTVKALADMIRDAKKKDILDLQPTDTVKKSGFWQDTNVTLGKPMQNAIGNYTLQFDSSDTENKTLRI